MPKGRNSDLFLIILKKYFVFVRVFLFTNENGGAMFYMQTKLHLSTRG